MVLGKGNKNGCRVAAEQVFSVHSQKSKETQGVRTSQTRDSECTGGFGSGNHRETLVFILKEMQSHRGL
jgi:hypothetical protein